MDALYIIVVLKRTQVLETGSEWAIISQVSGSKTITQWNVVPTYSALSGMRSREVVMTLTDLYPTCVWARWLDRDWFWPLVFKRRRWQNRNTPSIQASTKWTIYEKGKGTGDLFLSKDTKEQTQRRKSHQLNDFILNRKELLSTERVQLVPNILWKQRKKTTRKTKTKTDVTKCTNHAKK